MDRMEQRIVGEEDSPIRLQVAGSLETKAFKLLA